MAHRWALRFGSLHLGQGACVYLCTVVNLSLWTQESVLGAPLGPVDRIWVLLCVWVSLAGGHRSYGFPADPCPLVLYELAQEPAFPGKLGFISGERGTPSFIPFHFLPTELPTMLLDVCMSSHPARLKAWLVTLFPHLKYLPVSSIQWLLNTSMLFASLPTDCVHALHACRSDYCPTFPIGAGAVPAVGKDRYPPSLHLAEASI